MRDAGEMQRRTRYAVVAVVCCVLAVYLKLRYLSEPPKAGLNMSGLPTGLFAFAGIIVLVGLAIYCVIRVSIIDRDRTRE